MPGEIIRLLGGTVGRQGHPGVVATAPHPLDTMVITGIMTPDITTTEDTMTVAEDAEEGTDTTMTGAEAAAEDTIGAEGTRMPGVGAEAATTTRGGTLIAGMATYAVHFFFLVNRTCKK